VLFTGFRAFHKIDLLWGQGAASLKRLGNTTLILRAGPSRCGAQCKTWARGPSEQWFYDVIVLRSW